MLDCPTASDAPVSSPTEMPSSDKRDEGPELAPSRLLFGSTAVDVRLGVQTRTPSLRAAHRFRRVQTLVREGSPLVKLRKSA
jgi:hypothetical protein